MAERGECEPAVVERVGVGAAEADRGVIVRECAVEVVQLPKTSGMGLGLAITKKAIEDLRGQIRFTTKEGAGTTFEVALPLAPKAESLNQS